MTSEFDNARSAFDVLSTLKKGERAPEVLSLCFVSFRFGRLSHCCECFLPGQLPLFELPELAVTVPCEGHLRKAWHAGFEEVPEDSLDDDSVRQPGSTILQP